MKTICFGITKSDLRSHNLTHDKIFQTLFTPKFVLENKLINLVIKWDLIEYIIFFTKS
jgi:hypothetical protein